MWTFQQKLWGEFMEIHLYKNFADMKLKTIKYTCTKEYNLN